MTKTHSFNPHIQAMARLAEQSGLELSKDDIEQARLHKRRKCACDKWAYWKPTVGTYVCPACGAVLRKGEWFIF